MPYYITREYSKINNKWKGTYKLVTNVIVETSLKRKIILEGLSFREAFFYVTKGYGSTFVLDYSSDIRNYQFNRKIRVPSRRVE